MRFVGPGLCATSNTHVSLEHCCLTVARLCNRAVAGRSDVDVMTTVAWPVAGACFFFFFFFFTHIVYF